jgi:hypothetical protein
MTRIAIATATLAVGLLQTAPQAQAQAQAQPQTQTIEAPNWPVVSIVRVPKPALAPRALVASRMRDTQAEFARLDGLAFKAYSFERDSSDYGGLYLWRDDKAARGFFNEAWFERVRKERSVEGQVRHFVAPLTIDNRPGGTAADDRSAAVGTLVEVAVPAGVGAARLLAGFRAAVPQHQAAAGLLRKSFIWSAGPDGAPATFGGLYLWRDEAAARAWFNDAWQARVLQSYGRAARIEWFDTPILLPNAAQAGTLAAGTMIGAAP